MINWLESKAKSRNKGTIFSMEGVRSGVPEVPMLKQVVFNLFINDLDPLGKHQASQVCK